MQAAGKNIRSFDMRKILCFAIPVILLVACSVAFAADFWENKEFKKWSLKECQKMLTDSPWAKDLTLQQLRFSSDKASDDGRQFYIKYQVQFATALPIRQAQVRQSMIAQNYDDFDNEMKKQADQNAEAFLAKQFPDAIVVFVTYETNSQNQSRDLDRHWQSQTAELLKNDVFLRNSRGGRVDIAGYQAFQGEPAFQFIFPRQTEDGEELVKPDDKNLMLEFTPPSVGGLGGGRGFLEFKPEKMVLNGELTY